MPGEFFKRIFKFAESNGLSCRWGSKGFSLNLPIESNFVGLCLGYPLGSVFKQSIYSVIEQIDKKIISISSKAHLVMNGFDSSMISKIKYEYKKGEVVRVGYFGAISDKKQSYRNPT